MAARKTATKRAPAKRTSPRKRTNQPADEVYRDLPADVAAPPLEDPEHHRKFKFGDKIDRGELPADVAIADQPDRPRRRFRFNDEIDRGELPDDVVMPLE